MLYAMNDACTLVCYLASRQRPSHSMVSTSPAMHTNGCQTRNKSQGGGREVLRLLRVFGS